jgi:hypothetical protein
MSAKICGVCFGRIGHDCPCAVEAKATSKPKRKAKPKALRKGRATRRGTLTRDDHDTLDAALDDLDAQCIADRCEDVFPSRDERPIPPPPPSGVFPIESQDEEHAG